MAGLTVRIGGDWSGLRNTLSQANSALKNSFSSLGMAAGGTALVAATRSALNYADQVAKGAMRTGIATDEYQRLAYAANLSGASIESLGTGFKMLQNAIGSTKVTDEQKRAFTALGLAVDDLRKKNPTDQFLTVARALSEIPPGAEKTAIALDLLGRSGTELLPMLDGGAAGFDKLRESIEQAGGVMSQFELETAERFNDTMTQMETGGKRVLVGLVGLYSGYWDVIGKASAGMDPSDAAGRSIRAQNRDLIEQSKSGDQLRADRRKKEQDAKLDAIRTVAERADAEKKAAAEAAKAEAKRVADIKKAHEQALDIVRDFARDRALAELGGREIPTAARIAEGMTAEDIAAVGNGDAKYGAQIIQELADAQDAADEAALDAAEEKADAQKRLNELQEEYADALADVAKAERDAANADYLQQLEDNAERARDAVDKLKDALKDAARPPPPIDPGANPGAIVPLVNSPLGRRRLRKKIEEDQEFADKLAALARGERPRLTAKDKRRIKDLGGMEAAIQGAQGAANLAKNQLDAARMEQARVRREEQDTANLARLAKIEKDMATIAAKARGEE